MAANRGGERRKGRWLIGLIVLLVVVLGAPAVFLLRDTTSPAAAAPCRSHVTKPTGRARIVNGDFETPVVPRTGYRTFQEGTRFRGWSVVGDTGDVAPLGTEFTSDGLRFRAHAGQQTLDLTGLSNTATGIRQRVRTRPGTRYGLSFWSGNVVDPGGIYSTETTTNVLIDGAPVLSAHNTGGAGTRELAWKHFCVAFTARSSSTSITFMNGDPRSDNSDVVDDVALR